MLSEFSITDDMQKRTRKECRFHEVEADLPSYGKDGKKRSPSVSTDGVRDAALGFTSYLGSKSPVYRNVTAEDTVWLLDNTAYKNAETGKWEAEFVSAVFAQKPSCTVLEAVTAVAHKIGLQDNDPNYPTIEERVLPFIQDIRPGTKVKAIQADKTLLELGPGGRNGISSDVKTVLEGQGHPQISTTTADVPSGVNGVREMKTFFAEPEGWSVISDIDDTIKITMTSDPIGILRSTFTDTPQPCPGMPGLYQNISSMIGPAAPFFYLSASPYNLYPFLREFRDKFYPHGTIVLRDSSWMSIPGLLSSITLGTEQYKTDRMKKIHEWVPKRKMICIGDSTQADPESYGNIYRKFPGWVKLILIREVEDIAALGIKAKNEPKRFEKAFKHVPKDRWKVFKTAEECNGIIAKMIAEES
ncbi:hypothetical protein PG988_006261 [Apiospora saccharicola]